MELLVPSRMFWKCSRQQPRRFLQKQHLPDRGTDAYGFVPKTIDPVFLTGTVVPPEILYSTQRGPKATRNPMQLIHGPILKFQHEFVFASHTPPPAAR
ncbi:hypothetical protein AV530_013918 [Patagioenas fasciata monilis]|uniref:Uncharacterized protein n=1 Tax=Patagioenas fasciata monilis TaxID=372326 RepID=A0A1V4KPU7_PATFA|nr:hypothetical protein AV530_013918 [Patagioenas fasciata monilis]